ncbi:unnamed protein product [Linum trigynum]|uniref:Uncharacterized protein n=1 Tax=Linum trigynum TaxID=586398 RepID=A0AAV2CBL1_9ROSI
MAKSGQVWISPSTDEDEEGRRPIAAFFIYSTSPDSYVRPSVLSMSLLRPNFRDHQREAQTPGSLGRSQFKVDRTSRPRIWRYHREHQPKEIDLW